MLFNFSSLRFYTYLLLMQKCWISVDSIFIFFVIITFILYIINAVYIHPILRGSYFNLANSKLVDLQGCQKKVYALIWRDSFWEISKIFFDEVLLSIYSNLVKKLDLSKLCKKKGYGALKIPKMACSKLINFSFLFVFLKITTRKYLITMKYSFYFC